MAMLRHTFECPDLQPHRSESLFLELGYLIPDGLDDTGC